MTTKQYIITTGNHANYEIVAVVEGAARPALSTLSKQFNSAFKYPAPPKYPTSGDEMFHRFGERAFANARARESGLDGDDKARLFVDWLTKQHGFKVVTVDEMWVG